MSATNWYPNLSKHPWEIQQSVKVAYDNLYYLRDQNVQVQQQIPKINSSLAAKADAAAIKGATLTLIKLTSGGANGSITINSQGVVTSYVAPT